MQYYTNFEVWLVDDGSYDDCPAICDQYAEKDKRIRVIHKTNGGLSDARNAALDVAKGEYITFIDSDDYVTPDYVSTLYSLIDRYKAQMSIATWHIFPEGEKPNMPQVKVNELLMDKNTAINYDNLKSDINHRKIRYFISNIFDWSIVKEKGKIVQKKLLDKFNKKLSSEQAIRDAAFDRFQQRFITTEPYPSWGALTEACRDYDAVLVGSDQLWLPSNIVADYYTLSFVPKEVRKIAYATSFGIGAIPHGMENLYAHFLSRIDYLSARETSGQEIIKQSTGRDVPLVCDPTMLLEKSDWEKIATQRRIVNDNYIFCYFMGNNPKQRDFVIRIPEQVQSVFSVKS